LKFAKIELTSPRLITRVKKNINEVAFKARAEQLDRLCDANGGAFEDAELRGLVRTIMYLESIKPITCSIEQRIKREYDRELENTTVPAEFCVDSKALLKYMNMFAPIGRAFEDAEQRGLVRTIIYLESIRNRGMNSSMGLGVQGTEV
jgi:hypothetical protein